jgi:hypothetical protein
MRNVAGKGCRENQNTHFLSEISAVYEKKWKNILERGMRQMTKWGMALHPGYLRLQIHTQVV